MMTIMIGSLAVRHPVVCVAVTTLLLCLGHPLPISSQEREPTLRAKHQQAQLALERGDYAEAERVSRALI